MLNDKDIILIDKLQRHNDAAWTQLFKENYGILCVIASGYLRDDYEAESVVSDVLYNFYTKVSYLSINTSIRAYLIQSVRNSSLNVLKKKGPIACDPYDLVKIAEKMSEGEHPLGELLEKELEDSIRNAIKALSPRNRQIFEMSRFEGLNYNEISQKLGISINTVKYHMKQALMSLRNDIGEYMPVALLVFLMKNF